MKVDCTIDGKTITLSLNSNKPLSLILKENFENDYWTLVHCRGKLCGRCIVLLDDKAVPACMVPAFEIRGKTIQTFKSFRESREMQDIRKAYAICKVSPCKDCFESKSLVFESLIRNEITEKSEIAKELSIIKCFCVDYDDAVEIVRKAIEIRRKRRNNVRRS